jgi:hypothetical protein
MKKEIKEMMKQTKEKRTCIEKTVVCAKFFGFSVCVCASVCVFSVCLPA